MGRGMMSSSATESGHEATAGEGASRRSGPPVMVERLGQNIAMVTLNRPERLNALNVETRAMLRGAFDALQEDDSVRAVVLRGAGSRAFAAGADIRDFAARSPEEQQAAYEERRIFETVADFPLPVIAAIHGFCVGGGSELALACDVRVADRTVRMSQAEIRLGLIPGGGGTQRLPRLVGRGWASILSFTGDFLDAEEALRIGLIDRLVEEGEHVTEALDLANRMARWSPVALRLAKQSLRAAFELPLSDGLALEKGKFIEAFASEDGREGVRAFVEKRKPKFVGR